MQSSHLFKRVRKMAPILNLTQHTATLDQIAEGVIEQPHPEVKALLNFETLPTVEEIQQRANDIAEAIARYLAIERKEIEERGDVDSLLALQAPKRALIGGAPFFMSALESALIQIDVQPIYAFSQRESVEVHNSDGSVSKQNVFKHVGFIAGSKI